MENKKETLTAAEEQKRQQQFIEKARIYVREKSEELGRPLYACTTTFGCQMNARDSEKLDGVLEAVGYIKTEKEDEADFVFITPAPSVKMPTSVSTAAWDILAA